MGDRTSQGKVMSQDIRCGSCVKETKGRRSSLEQQTSRRRLQSSSPALHDDLLYRLYFEIPTIEIDYAVTWEFYRLP